MKTQTKCFKQCFVLLCVYHLSFFYFAWQYILENNGDAARYWFVNEDLSHRSWLAFFKPGTSVIQFFTFPLVKYLHLPFWSGFLIFSVIGLIGIYLLMKILFKISGENRLIQLVSAILLLLPNLHFWTSLIGKEPVIFLLVTLFAQEVYHQRYRSKLLVFSLFVVALIRPHVAFIILVGYVVSLMVTQKITLKLKLILGAVLFSSSAVFAWILVNLQDFRGGIPRVIRKYEAHIRHFKKTDAYVPLDEYPLPYKIFTFYFRPLPFEKSGLYYNIISIENLILLILFVVTTFFSIKYFSALKKEMLFVLPMLLLLLFAVMYVYAYANYGIIMRTRIMVAPFIFMVVVRVFSYGWRAREK